MNIPEPDLEKILLLAPSPKPPAGLKERLLAQAPSPTRRSDQPAYRAQGAASWLRRWWPSCATAMIILACGVLLAVQQRELNNLKQSLQILLSRPAQAQGAGAIAAPNPPNRSETSDHDRAEIDRLKQLAAQLAAEVAQLEQLRTENEKLRSSLATPLVSGLSPEENEAVEDARAKALSVACINNLKQFGLSVRVWAQDENDRQPPSVVCMSNELATPKVLLCPADTSRQAAADWSTFTQANCSYEYLANSGTNAAQEELRVLSRCPIHGHIGLCDGSVQGNAAKNHPDWFVNRDGKLYFERPLPPSGSAPAAPGP